MLVLASQSPRRRHFLEDAGVQFFCDPSNGLEAAWDGVTPPRDHVLALAIAKASEVSVRHPDDLVLAADTIVVQGEQIYGKPRDLADAKRMLRSLSGDSHHVLTGVAFCRGSQILRSWVSSSTVHFRDLTDTDIDHYFQLVSPLDKAGAYGVQDHGELIVEGIDGLWSNIVGLPIEEVLNELREQDITIHQWKSS